MVQDGYGPQHQKFEDENLLVRIGSGQDDLPTTSDPYTIATHTQIDVAPTSGAVLGVNTLRQCTLFINDSDTVIYLAFGQAAVANRGIRLNANGGNYSMSTLLGNLYRGAVNAIHGGGAVTKSLLILEGT